MPFNCELRSYPHVSSTLAILQPTASPVPSEIQKLRPATNLSRSVERPVKAESAIPRVENRISGGSLCCPSILNTSRDQVRSGTLLRKLHSRHVISKWARIGPKLQRCLVRAVLASYMLWPWSPFPILSRHQSAHALETCSKIRNPTPCEADAS